MSEEKPKVVTVEDQIRKVTGDFQVLGPGVKVANLKGDQYVILLDTAAEKKVSKPGTHRGTGKAFKVGKSILHAQTSSGFTQLVGSDKSINLTVISPNPDFDGETV